ncbi:MAG: hypothetical protein KGI98_14585 [Euryarchaeota archaeon]|nr:hypothetical protein [Euryarchaeota archaeon]MDE1881172.1 hypothetical protein [Euryarchaeota archaeon]
MAEQLPPKRTWRQRIALRLRRAADRVGGPRPPDPPASDPPPKRSLFRGRQGAQERKDFEARYGKKHGDAVYGATVGKVAREQAAASPSGVKIEHVRGHMSFSSAGAPERVRPHTARIVVSHPHSRGEHKGPCSRDCRAGKVGHTHLRSRRGAG